ncbi:ankyrin [Dacryopinax primogenitus]|uniref:Ankyrin n=1 Tax=Dacryopinax primogenitus (strain DJM 731) TaxID=1858805 RepID=M5FTL8_DACPD|nr:ankyrin [Dacryopinax primogenitus]EJU00996.1 ankyrin [Dacryopinax primogenitus]
MSTCEPSEQFKQAAEYVATSPKLKKLPNETKLQLYGLYKAVTVSASPSGPRPGLLSFEGRAKWDAWDRIGKEFGGKPKEEVERKYLDVCKSSGWEEGVAPEPTGKREEGGEGGSSGPAGLGVSVSQMLREDEAEHEGKNDLQGAVVRGDVGKVNEFLLQGEAINGVDEYGFTALHLAADRGHKEIVQLLLDRGANVGIKDPDGETAISLAREAGHEEIVVLIQQVLSDHGQEGQNS